MPQLFLIFPKLFPKNKKRTMCLLDRQARHLTFQISRKERGVDLQIAERLAQARQTTLSPLEWGRGVSREGLDVYQRTDFLRFWKMQGVAAQIVRLLLLGLISWFAIIVMLPWALAMTHVYDKQRQSGLTDPFETEGNRPSSWVIRGLMLLTFGWRAPLFVKVYNVSQRWRPAKMVLTAIGIPLFGIVVGHHLLRNLGLRQSLRYRLNMLARVVNVTVEAVEGKLFLHYTDFVWVWLFNQTAGRILIEPF